MQKISGLELEIENLTPSEWMLYFSAGKFEAPGVLNTIEPSQMKITKDFLDDVAYDIYYDPYRNRYTIPELEIGQSSTNKCEQGGYHMGGFLIHNCTLRYLTPTDICTASIRPFGDGYDDAYEGRTIIYDSCTDNNQLSAYNNDFNSDFGNIELAL